MSRAREDFRSIPANPESFPPAPASGGAGRRRGGSRSGEPGAMERRQIFPRQALPVGSRTSFLCVQVGPFKLEDWRASLGLIRSPRARNEQWRWSFHLGTLRSQSFAMILCEGCALASERTALGTSLPCPSLIFVVRRLESICLDRIESISTPSKENTQIWLPYPQPPP